MSFLKKIVPQSLIYKVKSYQAEQQKRAVLQLPKLDEITLEKILINEVGLKKGDVVFIHSSVDKLNLTFPFYNIISILRSILGDEGTFLFPTYPKLTSYKFLKSGEVFDVKKTASFTGILNEFARRQKDAVRSIHPTKSVIAIGKYAKELTEKHQNSPYPYDVNSPYYLINNYNAKIMGLGINTSHLSFVHVIDDYLKEKFPVFPYHDEIINANCRDYNGNSIIVPTYAHDMKKMGFDLPKFIDDNIEESIAKNINIDGMKFGICHSKPLFNKMVDMALSGKTIYKKSLYKKDWKPFK
jgi:aminoglycoside 3-N-acetyltransferase